MKSASRHRRPDDPWSSAGPKRPTGTVESQRSKIESTPAHGGVLTPAIHTATEKKRPAPRRALPSAAKALAVSTILLASSGCAQLLSLGMRQPIREGVEPQNSGRYYLYKPSNYDARKAWPLVVVCHGAFPDSAKNHIHNWTEAAESKGFLVAAPKLKSPGAATTRKAGKLIARLRDDEQHVLNTIQHVRGAYHISDDRVFIHGWSGGAIAALHTGLKHPDLFRAISVVQPKFQAALLADAEHLVDPDQPVFVDYSGTDTLTGNHARRLLDWLSDKHASVQEHGIGPARAGSVDRSVSFYENTIRSGLWIRIKVYPQDDPGGLTVRFRLKTSGTPVRYRWTFGDGDTSPVTAPVHTYRQPGTYRVKVSVATQEGLRDQQIVHIQVPNARIQRTQP